MALAFVIILFSCFCLLFGVVVVGCLKCPRNQFLGGLMIITWTVHGNLSYVVNNMTDSPTFIPLWDNSEKPTGSPILLARDWFRNGPCHRAGQ